MDQPHSESQMNESHLVKGVQLSLADSAWKSLPTPKIRKRTSNGVLGWAHAYAGFSYEFASEAARMLKTSGSEQFLDPFVGSGTSALAAIQEGLPFIGIDIDPFLFVHNAVNNLGLQGLPWLV